MSQTSNDEPVGMSPNFNEAVQDSNLPSQIDKDADVPILKAPPALGKRGKKQGLSLDPTPEDEFDFK